MAASRPFQLGELMSTSSVKESPEDAAFFRPKIDWLLKHYTVLAAIAATFLYALGYFFFDGYLSGFGYSMDAMPQDHVAVVMRAFFFFVYVWIYTVSHVFGIGVATLIVAVAMLVAIAVLYAILKFCARFLDRLVTRWRRFVPRCIGAALARRSAAGEPPGILDRAFAWLVVFVAAIALPAVVLWVCWAFFVITFIGVAQYYGDYLAREQIRKFVKCEARPFGDRMSKRCVEIDAGKQGQFVGDVVAGSTDWLLIFDGNRARLLKRSDELKAVVLVKPIP